MKRLAIIVFILFPTLAFGQPLLKELPNYSFINYGINQLVYPNGRIAQNKFYDKLDSLILFGNRNIQIVHIGGSHVQADVFSNRMRQNLTQMLPGLQSERGILFPFRIAKTNNPTNYLVFYQGKWERNLNSRFTSDIPLGICGVAVKTCDKTAGISVKLNRHALKQWSFNQFRLIGYAENDSILPMAIVHGDTIEPIVDLESHSYLFLCQQTDSIHLFFKQLSNHPRTFTISGMLPENACSGIVYHALGVNGASVAAWLRCINFEQELANIKPDLVIMAIGINDANVPYGKFDTEAFKNNYSLLIERIQRVSPDCAFLFITNNDAGYLVARRRREPNKNGAIARQAFFDLASQYEAGVWDLYTIMGGYGSMKRWQQNGLSRTDHIHFTLEGYNLLGDMLYNALITDYLYRK